MYKMGSYFWGKMVCTLNLQDVLKLERVQMSIKLLIQTSSKCVFQLFI